MYVGCADSTPFTVSGVSGVKHSKNVETTATWEATFQDRLNGSRFIVAQDSSSDTTSKRFRPHGLKCSNSSSGGEESDEGDVSSDESSSSGGAGAGAAGSTSSSARRKSSRIMSRVVLLA